MQKQSCDELCNLAEQALNEFSPSIAAKYYEQAIELKPKNALLFHKLGICHVDSGEPELAHEAFLKSIELSPNETASNYLYIGQQCFGYEAKKAFTKGIDIMKNELNQLIANENDMKESKNETKISKMKLEISEVHVSIAELFMTDLCEEKEAQIECEKHLNLAISECASNIEALAAFGEFRYCQNNPKSARSYFALSLSKLFGDQHNNDNNTNNDEIENEIDVFGSENAMTIDSYLKIVKLGFDLEQYSQCSLLLKNLLKCNDEFSKLWALSALCYHKMNDQTMAQICLQNAICIYELDPNSELNIESKDVLDLVQNELIDLTKLPDINKLKLDEPNINSFLADGDGSDDATDDDDDIIDID